MKNRVMEVTYTLPVTADFCSGDIYIRFLSGRHYLYEHHHCGCGYHSVVHFEVKSRPGLALPPGQVPPDQVQAWAGIPSRSSPGLGWHSLQVKSRPGLAFPPGQVQAWADIPSRSSPCLGWHSLQVKSRPGGLAFPPGQVQAWAGIPSRSRPSRSSLGGLRHSCWSSLYLPACSWN